MSLKRSIGKTTESEPSTRKRALLRKEVGTGKRPDGRSLTPLRAIRAKCLDCCCWLRSEVTLCAAQECALWPFRFGKRPSTVRRRQAKADG